MAASTDRILTFRDIQKITGRSRSTIWRWEKIGYFPKRVQPGPNTVGWFSSEIESWMQRLASERR